MNDWTKGLGLPRIVVCPAGRLGLFLAVFLLLAACGPDTEEVRRIVRDEIARVEVPNDFSDVYIEAVESVVCVLVKRDEIGWSQCATGFYVDDAGTVFTAEHVVELEDYRVERIAVLRSEGRPVEYIVHRELDHLRGVLLVPRDVQITSKPLPIANSTSLGELVIILGYAENLIVEEALIVTQGVVGAMVGFGGPQTSIDYLMSDTATYYGGSGGPWLNRRGEVVAFTELGGGEDGPYSYGVDLTRWVFQ